MRADYILSDLGKASKAFVFTAVVVLLDNDLVGYAMPFPDQAVSRNPLITLAA